MSDPFRVYLCEANRIQGNKLMTEGVWRRYRRRLISLLRREVIWMLLGLLLGCSCLWRDLVDGVVNDGLDVEFYDNEC